MNKLKQVWGFIKKIPTIIKAKIKDKKKLETEEWYKERIEICSDCPLNSKNKEKKSVRYYILSILNLRNDFCTDCGCELTAKASEEMEECPQGKWKQLK